MVPNRVDNKGGFFVMLGSYPAPGENLTQTSESPINCPSSEKDIRGDKSELDVFESTFKFLFGLLLLYSALWMVYSSFTGEVKITGTNPFPELILRVFYTMRSGNISYLYSVTFESACLMGGSRKSLAQTTKRLN